MCFLVRWVQTVILPSGSGREERPAVQWRGASHSTAEMQQARSMAGHSDAGLHALLAASRFELKTGLISMD